MHNDLLGVVRHYVMSEYKSRIWFYINGFIFWSVFFPKPQGKNGEVSCLFVYQSLQFGNYSRVGSFRETLTRFECKLWEMSASPSAVRKAPVLFTPLQTC